MICIAAASVISSGAPDDSFQLPFESDTHQHKAFLEIGFFKATSDISGAISNRGGIGAGFGYSVYRKGYVDVCAEARGMGYTISDGINDYGVNLYQFGLDGRYYFGDGAEFFVGAAVGSSTGHVSLNRVGPIASGTSSEIYSAVEFGYNMTDPVYLVARYQFSSKGFNGIFAGLGGRF